MQLGATFALSVSVVTGSSRPASSARQRFARSVVTSRSASVASPSRRRRSNSSGAVPPRSSTSSPVSLLEGLEGLLVAVLGAAVVDDDVGRSGEREGGHAEAGDDHEDGGGDEAQPAADSRALG